jgi:hypothetical protein
VQDKEGENTYHKIIVNHNLSDGVSNITKWKILPMGSCNLLLLQMHPNPVSHLKLVWNLVFLIITIPFLQNTMDLLADVVNPLNKLGGFVFLRLKMGIFFPCGHKGKCNINGTRWLKSQPHLKGVLAGLAMEIFIIAMMNIEDTLIPCAWILGVVHVKDIHDHPLGNLYLAISLGVGFHGFGEIGVHE